MSLVVYPTSYFAYTGELSRSGGGGGGDGGVVVEVVVEVWWWRW